MGDVVRLGPTRPSISFEFKMTPLPKGRTRSFLQGGKLVVTKDKRSRDYESLIGEATALQYNNTTPLEGDLIATVTFYLKDKKHGDLDNLLKAILDGMQGVAFFNDRQVRGFNVHAAYFNELPEDERVERTTVILSHRDVIVDAQEDDDISDWLEPQTNFDPDDMPFVIGDINANRIV